MGSLTARKYQGTNLSERAVKLSGNLVLREPIMQTISCRVSAQPIPGDFIPGTASSMIRPFDGDHYRLHPEPQALAALPTLTASLTTLVIGFSLAICVSKPADMDAISPTSFSEASAFLRCA
jgi:hypothetical protein